MKEIIIRKAKAEEIDWVNSKYEEIGFVISDFDIEYIAIAEVEGVYCGLGRLTKIETNHLELGGIYVFDGYRGLGVADKIVKLLLNQTSTNEKVWCLPFNHLVNFYSKFGFIDHTQLNNQIPDKIVAKHQWCNATYDKEVLLLVK